MISAIQEPTVSIFKLDPRDAITVGPEANLIHEDPECQAAAGARWPLIKDEIADIVLAEGPHWCPLCSKRHRAA